MSLDDLGTPALDPFSKRRLLRDLRELPWCWPGASDASRREHALALAAEAGLTGPPEPRAGEVLLLAAERGGAVCVLGPAAVGRHGLPFGARSHAAWKDAARALPRSVPVLWTSVREHQREPPRAACIGSEGGPVTALDGRSFGLAFVLALASKVWNEPVPARWAATAEVDADGRTSAVGGLEAKISVLTRHAGQVDTLLVASEQEEEAGAIAGQDLRVVGVESAADAVERVFGDAPWESVEELRSDPRRREELSLSLLRLVMPGHAGFSRWTPVAEAARVALESWPEKTEDEQRRCELARAIALRHEGAQEKALVLSDLHEGWASRLPEPLRTDCLAHLVQQAADTGRPDPGRLEALAASRLLEGEDATLENLRLRGALGRLALAKGELRRALDLSRTAAQGFFDRLEVRQISRALCAALVAAGALGDDEALTGLAALHERAMDVGGFEEEDHCFCDLALARARVTVGVELEAARAALEALVEGKGLRDHVRWSAMRWLARLDAGSGDAGAAAAMRERLVEDAGEDDAFVLLARLDECLLAGDEAGAARAVECLQGIEVCVLWQAARAPGPAEAASQVARAFPY